MKLPHWVFYTNRFVNKGAAATTRGLLVFIRPEYKGDESIMVHEYTHVRQVYRYCGLLTYFKWFSVKVQLSIEAEAFVAARMATRGEVSDNFIEGLAKRVMKHYKFYDKTTLAQRIACLKKWRSRYDTRRR